MSETGIDDLLTVDQAISIIDGTPVRPRTLEISLSEAYGRILAEDLAADRDYPPFDKSLMDGYAVRAVDVRETPAELSVVGEIPAGQTPQRGIGSAETMAIVTGAPLPAGADGVVPVEWVEVNEGFIRVIRAGDPREYITKAGAEAEAGQVVLRAGARLASAQLAAAATVGATRVRVYAPPRVAVLATGAEIVPFDQSPTAVQIRNCNNIMLSSLLGSLGCDVSDLGLAPDREGPLRDALCTGMQHDALMVSGGMSMGRYDLVPRMLRELQVDLKITKVRMKPGKPFVFGISAGGCYIFGLPGNPVSAFVCVVRLASRLLTRLAGGAVPEHWLTARLLAPLPPNGPRELYQPVLLERRADEAVVQPLLWKGSADVFTLAAANALLLRRENEGALSSGAIVRVMVMPGFPYAFTAASA